MNNIYAHLQKRTLCVLHNPYLSTSLFIIEILTENYEVPKNLCKMFSYNTSYHLGKFQIKLYNPTPSIIFLNDDTLAAKHVSGVVEKKPISMM